MLSSQDRELPLLQETETTYRLLQRVASQAYAALLRDQGLRPGPGERAVPRTRGSREGGASARAVAPVMAFCSSPVAAGTCPAL